MPLDGSNRISERANLKIFLWEHAPRPPYIVGRVLNVRLAPPPTVHLLRRPCFVYMNKKQFTLFILVATQKTVVLF